MIKIASITYPYVKETEPLEPFVNIGGTEKQKRHSVGTHIHNVLNYCLIGLGVS